MADVKDNVYAPNEVHVEDVHPEGEFELANRGTRFGAFLLDCLTGGVIGFVAAIAVPGLTRGAGEVVPGIGLLFVAFLTLAILIVNCIFLHRNGQTIGKKLVNIKVVRSNGERTGLTRIFFVRYLPVALLGAIPYIGFLFTLTDNLLIFRESRKCLHDTIADTIVVKA